MLPLHFGGVLLVKDLCCDEYGECIVMMCDDEYELGVTIYFIVDSH